MVLLPVQAAGYVGRYVVGTVASSEISPESDYEWQGPIQDILPGKGDSSGKSRNRSLADRFESTAKFTVAVGALAALGIAGAIVYTKR